MLCRQNNGFGRNSKNNKIRNDKMKKWIKSNWPVIILWLIFETVAVTLTCTTKNKFYLFNFSYIGTCLATGIYLYSHKIKYARNIVQFAVGLYMLVYL